MRSNLLIIAAATVAISFFGLMGWLTVSTWNECRAEHSWFYCVKLISR